MPRILRFTGNFPGVAHLVNLESVLHAFGAHALPDGPCLLGPPPRGCASQLPQGSRPQGLSLPAHSWGVLRRMRGGC